MSAIFSHAMRYEWLNRNPIALVRQSAKRERLPDVLTAEEIGALLVELPEPCRTAILLAACTGLRVSELLALKWSDVHFDAGEIRPVRAIVDQVVGSLKTEASGKAVPMDAALAGVVLDWRGRCPYNQDGTTSSAHRTRRASNPTGLTACYARSSGPLRSVLACPSISAGTLSGERWRRCCKPLAPQSRRHRTCCVMRVADSLSICMRSPFRQIGGRRNQALLERSWQLPFPNVP